MKNWPTDCGKLKRKKITYINSVDLASLKDINLNLKQRIVGSIIITVLLVGTVGVFTYLQFSDVVRSLEETKKEDPIISKTKTILAKINRAESRVQSFNLTEDTTHLGSYHQLKADVDSIIKTISPDKIQLNNEYSVDTLVSLVDERFAILDQLIEVRNEFRVEEALENISETIEEAKVETPKKENTEEKGWFKRTFKKNEEENQTSADQVDFSKVNAGIRNIQRIETAKEELQVKRELALLELQSKNIEQLSNILDSIEASEKEAVKKKSDEMEMLIKRTNKQIIIFCVVICLLLFSMTYTILKFIRKNNAYRKMMKKAKEEAESLAETKALFVATVSHEIRTPINIISGFSEQLSKTDLDEEQEDQLGAIRQSCSHLLDLTNAVLDFSKLENNKLTLDEQPFKPKTLVSTISSILKKTAEENNVQIETEIDESVPNFLIGDSFRLRQVLLNLVGNSIKFTSNGTVEIYLSCGEVKNNSIDFKIQISDDGIGMNKEQLKKVFNEFEQADKTTTRRFGGTGLGLSITKKLIELQNGTIKMESIEGVGTTVNVTIPLKVSELEFDEVKEVEVHVDFQKKKILVVDDEPFNRKLIESLLIQSNAEILTSSNGKEAIDLVKNNAIDLILMDAQMPVMGGVEATEEIRKFNAEIPIFALSAAVTTEDKKLYKDAGMNGVIAKPFKSQQLLKTIAQSFEIEVVNKTHTIEKELTSKSVDFSDLFELSNGDIRFYIEMLDTFEKSTQESIEKINVSLVEKDFESIAEYAHKISAPCKHISANKLYQLIKQIETNCRQKVHLETMDDLVKKMETEAKIVLDLIAEEKKQHSS